MPIKYILNSFYFLPLLGQTDKQTDRKIHNMIPPLKAIFDDLHQRGGGVENQRSRLIGRLRRRLRPQVVLHVDEQVVAVSERVLCVQVLRVHRLTNQLHGSRQVLLHHCILATTHNTTPLRNSKQFEHDSDDMEERTSTIDDNNTSIGTVIVTS